jgi:hypothetical protein
MKNFAIYKNALFKNFADLSINNLMKTACKIIRRTYNFWKILKL